MHRRLIVVAAVLVAGLVLASEAEGPPRADEARPAQLTAPEPPRDSGEPAGTPPASTCGRRAAAALADASDPTPPPSRAIGKPYAGSLRGGVLLAQDGVNHVSWDPILRCTPGREWRRYGTARLVRLILRVAARYRARHPDAPRVLVGDLSRPRGGDFGPRFGGLGHASHQNGLDVDVYYPRVDRLDEAPRRPADVDFRLAQALVDEFVRAGAIKAFVGPRVRLRGPRRIVQPLVHHDDHVHVRIRAGG